MISSAPAAGWPAVPSRPGSAGRRPAAPGRPRHSSAGRTSQARCGPGPCARRSGRARRRRDHRRAVARRLGGLGREHHAGPVGQGRQQRREGRRQAQAYGTGVEHVDRLDRAELAAPGASRAIEGAFEVEAHRLGVERFAVMEDDARAQLHGQGRAALGPRPGGGELRNVVRSVARSTSLSQRPVKTMRPTKLRHHGVEQSGSSANPIRRVCAAARSLQGP